MADERCERCQSKHELKDCKIQRAKIKKTRFWSDCADADAKEVKEKEFMAQFPGNVQAPGAAKPAPSASAPPKHTQPGPPKPTASSSAPSKPSQPKSAPPKPSQPQPAQSAGKQPAGSSAQLPHRPPPTPQSREGPNQTGFPGPMIHLPSPQRRQPNYNEQIFREKTQPIEEVPANVNLSKNPPAEYKSSNSLRSQYGTGGTKVRVITNYVAIKKAPGKLFEYTVNFGFNAESGGDANTASAQAIKRKKELRRVFESLRNQHPLQSRNDWATDFERIWSVRPLFDGPELMMSNVGYFLQSGREVFIPQVTFRLGCELNFGRGHLDLVEVRAPDGSPDVAMKSRALNAIVSNYMCLSTSTPIAQVGANRFFLEDAYTDMGHDSPFVTIRGYYSSIRPGVDRMLLNVSPATSAFFKPMLVSQCIQALQRQGVKPWAIRGMLKNVEVRITYNRPVRPGSALDPNREESRRKTIAGLGRPPSLQKFSLDGNETSVADFFRTARLQHANNLPCVNVGADRPGKELWVPPELLEIEYPQPFTSVLPPAYTDKMMQVALRGPAANANLIVNEGLVHLGIKDSPGTAVSRPMHLKDIDFEIEDRLIDIPGRILNGPKLQYYVAKAAQSQAVMPRFASWNLVDPRKGKFPFAVPTQLPRIGILTLGSSGVPPQALARELRKTLGEHGIRVQNGQDWFHTGDARPDQEGSYVASMKQLINTVESEMRASVITVVLLPKPDFDVYAALKTVCDTRGLRTICSASPPRKAMNEQTLSNIALKFSLKTGGRPHSIAGGLRVGGDTMIMGADVTHPAKGAKMHCPSVAAAVGSFDQHAINYGASMRLQKSRQEVISEMEDMARELLVIYGKKNNKLPSNIIYYRDGVSEGQYEDVRRKEITAIETAWEVLKKSGRPSLAPKVKITCLVVGKRHNTRFYPMKDGDADRSSNVKPGLVVDSVITHPYCFDFFLQSHAAVKGTARSAHYFLLRNDMALGAQALQDVTHALCYAYGTATKGISYCAPAYLADKLCDRGRAYIRDWLLGRPSLSSMIQGYDRRALPAVTIAEHERREAWRLNRNPPFNVWEKALGGQFWPRMNPWHPDLDDKMFWI